MAIELIVGLVRAHLQTKRNREGLQANVMMTKDADGDFKVTFSSDQSRHDKAGGFDCQYFDLNGLKDFRSLLDAVIEEEEEID